MSVDPALIQAIRSAVEAQPDNHELRLHLADLLLRANRSLEALHEARVILEKEPAHLAALKTASRSAEASGQPELASGYQKLAAALGWSQTEKLLSGLDSSDEGEEKDFEVLEPDEDQEPEASTFPTLDDFESFVDESEEESQDDDEGPVEARILLGGMIPPPEPEFERSDITLQDVAGMEAVKRRLELAFLAPLRNPDLRRMFKKNLKGGLLLYGPPGCGKTHIARALAGELMARFLSVSITDVMDMYVGQSEKNLHDIFASARRLAPVVIFFDELDALGRKRSLMRESGGRSAINQLLHELDGLDGGNEGIYVLAATNHPWDVDSALRRPGRFDRTILVTPPDQAAREKLLRLNLEGRPSDTLQLDWIAKSTEDYSGADMVHLVETATEFAMEDSMRKGTARPIQMDDFRKALKEVKPSIRQWLDSAKKYVIYANEGGQWDELRDYLKGRRAL